MDTKVTAFAAAPEVNIGQRQPAPRPAAHAEPPAPSADPLDLRLVIEEDSSSGSFVYKTINRLTGEVIQSLPRAEILKLRSEAAYAAGAVVRTKI